MKITVDIKFLKKKELAKLVLRQQKEIKSLLDKMNDLTIFHSEQMQKLLDKIGSGVEDESKK